MAKKKVMKTVSVPTLKEVEVATCDICGKEVGDYRWWMSMETDDGCMGEFYLDIDVCKKHGGLVHSYFSGDMSRYITHTRERYVKEYEMDNEQFINELKEYEMDKDDYY